MTHQLFTSSTSAQPKTTPSFQSVSAVTVGIRGILATLLADKEGKAIQVADDVPFGDAGLDSLGAMAFRGELSSCFGFKLDPTTMYSFPTVAALSRYVSGRLGIVAMSDDVPTRRRHLHAKLRQSGWTELPKETREIFDELKELALHEKATGLGKGQAGVGGLGLQQQVGFETCFASIVSLTHTVVFPRFPCEDRQCHEIRGAGAPEGSRVGTDT